MKRQRSPSSGASEREVEGGSNSDRAHSEASSQPASLESSPASSSLSSRRDSGGEEPDKAPLYALLDVTLALMKPAETVSATLRRLSDSSTGSTDFNTLTETHSACHAQYDLVLMSMTREAILLRALSERAKSGQGPPPPAWFLRWQGNPTVQGPFSAEQLAQWAAGGFFEKRSATVLNGSEVSGHWEDSKVPFPRTPS